MLGGPGEGLGAHRPGPPMSSWGWGGLYRLGPGQGAVDGCVRSPPSASTWFCLVWGGCGPLGSSAFQGQNTTEVNMLS